MVKTKKIIRTTSGHCYICGAELGKTAMQNHIFKEHTSAPDGEKCYMFKIEGAYNKKYWLLLDIASNKSLDALDSFLRQIWLECCDHLSAFRAGGGELDKRHKIGSLFVGEQFIHEYDFGSTTESLITIIGETHRPKQRDAVRLIARNIPPNYECTSCGKPAQQLCMECTYDGDNDNPFFCEECFEKHGEIHDTDMALPVTNSPRIGVCGYCGDEDIWALEFSESPKPSEKKAVGTLQQFT